MPGFFNTLRQMMRPESYYTGAKLQERIDLLRLYMIVRTHAAWPEKVYRCEADILAIEESMAQQADVVQQHVVGQTMQMMSGWKIEKPPPLPPHAKLPARASESEVAAAEELRASIVAEWEEELQQAQMRAFGYVVHVSDSDVAGRGVFVRGKAKVGSVVSLYPGVTMLPADILRIPMAALKARYKDNDFMIQRWDGTLLDGSEKAVRLLPPNAATFPPATAQLLNHPPAGVLPNIFPCAINFDDRFPASLLSYLPNVRYEQAEPLLLESGSRPAPRTWLDRIRFAIADTASTSFGSPAEHPLRGLAFVAARDIEDEELFFNYRLNPNEKLPKWYHTVDGAESRRRWDLIK